MAGGGPRTPRRLAASAGGLGEPGRFLRLSLQPLAPPSCLWARAGARGFSSSAGITVARASWEPRCPDLFLCKLPLTGGCPQTRRPQQPPVLGASRHGLFGWHCAAAFHWIIRACAPVLACWVPTGTHVSAQGVMMKTPWFAQTLYPAAACPDASPPLPTGHLWPRKTLSPSPLSFQALRPRSSSLLLPSAHETLLLACWTESLSLPPCFRPR